MINTSIASFYRAIPHLNTIQMRQSTCIQMKLPMANQILVIAPFWLESAGTWVFDDEAVELVQEPFVSGVPEMINDLVADIPNAKSGFRMLFSGEPFPGYQQKMTRVREETGGTALMSRNWNLRHCTGSSVLCNPHLDLAR
jgi:hypothetical protein